MFDLDVILAAHGAGNNSAANKRVHAYARSLEQALAGARITAAFNVGEPTHYSALVSASRARRVVVPLFTSDGYYAARLRRDVERSFRGGHETEVLPPLGQNRLIVEAISAQVVAQLILQQIEAATCSVVVVGHGTTRHPGSGLATLALAKTIRGVVELPAQVAFLDAQPSVEETVLNLSSGKVLLVVPFLFGGGDHAERDVPARVNDINKQRDHPFGHVAFLEPMGGLPLMTSVLERVVLDTQNAWAVRSTFVPTALEVSGNETESAAVL